MNTIGRMAKLSLHHSSVSYTYNLNGNSLKNLHWKYPGVGIKDFNDLKLNLHSLIENWIELKIDFLSCLSLQVWTNYLKLSKNYLKSLQVWANYLKLSKDYLKLNIYSYISPGVGEEEEETRKSMAGYPGNGDQVQLIISWSVDY